MTQILSSRKSLGLVLLLASTMLLVGPAMARPKSCSSNCTPSTPPHILCTCHTPGAPVTTCGEWFDNFCGLLLTPALPTTILDGVITPENGATHDATPAALAKDLTEAPTEKSVQELEPPKIFTTN